MKAFNRITMKRLLLLGVLALALAPAGCAVTRVTTTPRTAVEQALITHSTQQSIRQFKPVPLRGQTFTIDERYMDANDRAFLPDLKSYLLGQGLNASTEEKADLVVTPRVLVRAIDDADSFIGLPAIPILIPGVGTVQTPSLAIYKSSRQYGRSELGFSIHSRQTGAQMHDQPPVFGLRAYRRYTLLFLIDFRTSDLDRPF